VTGIHVVEPMPDEPQRIIVGCDMVPGPLAEAVAERILAIVVGELRAGGIVVTAIRVELQGRSTAW
jgi:hypothetical protein